MLTKLMPVVVSLWVLLFSTQVIAETFTDTVKRVVPSVCMVTSAPIPVIADDKDQKTIPPVDEQQNPFENLVEQALHYQFGTIAFLKILDEFQKNSLYFLLLFL